MKRALNESWLPSGMNMDGLAYPMPPYLAFFGFTTFFSSDTTCGAAAAAAALREAVSVRQSLCGLCACVCARQPIQWSTGQLHWRFQQVVLAC